MIVVGVDISTKTGIAFVNEHEQVVYAEEIEYKKVNGMQRCGMIASRCMDLISHFQPEFACVENYGFANAHTLVPLVEVGTLVRYMMFQENVKWADIPPNSLKKFVVGDGKATKDMVMMHVFKKWNYESKTNNIADAVGLAMLGLYCHPIPRLNPGLVARAGVVKKAGPDWLQNL